MQARTPTVQWQVLVRLLPLLVVLFVCALLWLGQYLEGILLSANLEDARRLNLVVVHAIQVSMLTETGHRVWDRVVDQIPHEEKTDIEILDAGGTVLFSTDPAKRGTTRHLTDPLCAGCHENGSRQATTETAFVQQPSDEGYQVFAAPLRNTSECQACHSHDGQKLGMVLVRHSLSPVNTRVRTVQIALAIVGGMALLLTVLMINVLVSRYLGRPLRKLVVGARAIGAGELGHTIELPVRSELNVLADTLNTSAARLAEMVSRLERQRDDFQTLYRLVDQLSRTVLPEERRRRAVELACKILNTEFLVVSADGALTFGSGSEVVEGTLSDDAEAPGAPSFYSSEIVKRWARGELSERNETREGKTVAFPLRRSGRRLGLALRPAQKYDDVPASELRPDPEMVQALYKHLAIAFEFSDLQRELIREERLAAIGETVAGLAHWLKNTLNGLRGGQYVIDRAVQIDDMEKLRKGWCVMKTSIQQVEKLTSDLLYCAKERVPEREPTDPNQVIRDVVGPLRETAAGQGVELRLDLDPRITEEALDRHAIRRALLDLVTNAIDACTESESGQLVIVKSRVTPDEVVLTVEDNGIGMSDVVLKNLFTHFFSTKGSKGTGLGLPVVKKIAEEHGGAVAVESEFGKGSAFHIRLPRTTKTDAGSVGEE